MKSLVLVYGLWMAVFADKDHRVFCLFVLVRSWKKKKKFLLLLSLLPHWAETFAPGCFGSQTVYSALFCLPWQRTASLWLRIKDVQPEPKQCNSHESLVLWWSVVLLQPGGAARSVSASCKSHYLCLQIVLLTRRPFIFTLIGKSNLRQKQNDPNDSEGLA